MNGTVRYEGSNKLGKSRSARWLPTWNISGAWNARWILLAGVAAQSDFSYAAPSLWDSDP